MPPRTASENRTDPRAPVAALLVCFPFSSQKNFSCEVIACNASVSGLYFECRHPFKDGQYLFVRLKKAMHSERGQDAGYLKAHAMVRVRWCEQMDRDLDTRYGVGVEYF